jgi:hypothetical protein
MIFFCCLFESLHFKLINMQDDVYIEADNIYIHYKSLKIKLKIKKIKEKDKLNIQINFAQKIKNQHFNIPAKDKSQMPNLKI